LGAERSVEVREEFAAARGLPAQRRAQVVGLDLEHHEVGLAVEVPPGRLLRLAGGREVDEAVLAVDGRTLETACALRRRPVRGRQDLVDPAQSHRSGRNSPSYEGRPAASNRNTAAAAVGNWRWARWTSEAGAAPSLSSWTASSCRPGLWPTTI